MDIKKEERIPNGLVILKCSFLFLTPLLSYFLLNPINNNNNCSCFYYLKKFLATYEGCLKSFRSNKETKHFFFKFISIFLRSFIISLYASSRNARLPQIHPNITWRLSLKNNYLRWWWLPYSTEISVLSFGDRFGEEGG